MLLSVNMVRVHIFLLLLVLCTVSVLTTKAQNVVETTSEYLPFITTETQITETTPENLPFITTETQITETTPENLPLITTETQNTETTPENQSTETLELQSVELDSCDSSSDANESESVDSGLVIIVSSENSNETFSDDASNDTDINCSDDETTETTAEVCCGENEVLSNCKNIGSVAQNCSQLGYPLSCTDIDPQYCQKGCICQDGYLRAKNGKCVPIEKCDSSCGGDPNSTPGCGVNCGKRCSDYNKGPVACILICYLNACDCKKGYVFDDNLKKCVKPEDCTPICKKNEVFSNCTNSGCATRNCSQIGSLVHGCPKIDPKHCKQGCVCQEGYLYSDDGTCVLKENCKSSTSCRGDHNAISGCGSNCGRLCSNYNKPPVLCSLICRINGCDCKKGYVFDTNIKKCVKPEDCTPTCKINEVFSNCINGGCIPQNCSQLGYPVPCSIVDLKICKKGCICQDGYARNKNGTCVLKKNCDSPCGGDPNSQPGCGVNCGRLCPNQNTSKICPKICKVNACDCKEGYFFDSNTKTCVLREQCTPTCPENQVFNSCTNSGCVPQNCSQLGYPVPCVRLDPKFCQKGCTCKEGYLFSKNGTCVLKEKCDTPCGGDPNSTPGCGSNCGRLCSNYNKGPVACPLICNLNGCDCKEGYVLDENTNKCVKPENCTSCGGDPNAAPGCGVNCGRRCSNYNKGLVACPLICNLNGCDCKKGYVFDDNIKKCVKPEHCTPTCKINEVFSNCINGGCIPQNCSQLGYPVPCSIVDLKICKKGCICQDGYARNKNGTCVLKKNCDSPCGGDPNSQPGCGVNCGRLCPNQNTSKICPKICKVNACDCKEGYFFDSNTKTCVLREQCTPTCPENQIFNSCTNSGCVPQNCSQLGYPVPCVRLDPKFCQKGCTCKEGYLFSKDGTCVLKEKCDTPCGGDPNSTPGCGSNCGRLCSNYNKGPVACPLICNLNGCDCKEGYVLDENTNKCVKPENCTPVCKKNEVFSSCTNIGCLPKNCSQLGFPVPCVRLDPKFCKKGCTCKDGYLFSEDGTCVLKENCNTSCGGDPNAAPGCGVNCGRRCSNYNKGPVACPLICNLNGCDCKKGYVFDDNIKKCVKPEHCTPLCKENEVFNDCINGGCDPKNCSQLGYPVPCVKLDPKNCRKGCSCKDGYLLSENGTCVLKENCNTPCGGDPNAVPGCGTNCGRHCADIGQGPVACKQICNLNGCDCKPGFVLDDETNKCVKPEQCTSICNENEVYSPCVNGGCDRRNCSQLNRPQICIDLIEGGCIEGCVCKEDSLRDEYGHCIPVDECPERQCSTNEVFNTCASTFDPVCVDGKVTNNDNVTITLCRERCVCKPGFIRNINGECISLANCKKCNRPNEIYSCGGACDNVCATLSEQNQTNCPIINIKCNEMCYCKDGYARDENNVCVPIESCPGFTCKANEVYSSCVNGGCERRNCSQLNQPILCIDLIEGACIGGCVCQIGFLRNELGICVPEDQCPERQCSTNEVFNTCAGSFDPVCVDGKVTNNDNIGIALCRERCVCKPGFIRNSKGDCISLDQCKRQCSTNEVFNTCAPSFDPVCVDGKVTNNDNITITLCRERCVCKPGLIRNSKGECISLDQCTSTCKKNEVFSSRVNGGCDQRICSQLKQPIVCIDRIQSSCISGCVCQKGLLRNEQGICIPEVQCPGSTCKENEVYSSCVNGGCTRRDCSQLKKPILCKDPIPGGCVGGCVCQKGSLRNKSGICVPEDQCPERQCSVNEVFNTCAPSFDPVCVDGKVTNNDNVTITLCRERCVCKPGFIRNINGECISLANCQKCNGPNEYYTCGGACDNVCATLSKQNQTNCPIINVKCNEKCYCKKGYARDPNNICVPINTCPVTTNNCGINEEYAKCSNSICRPQNCSQKGQILFCAAVIPSICIGKCVCKVGFLRNENNMCIAESKCPETFYRLTPYSSCFGSNPSVYCQWYPERQCSVNEVFNTCAPSFDPVCVDGKVTNNDNVTITLCRERCVCKPGFIRNINGECISLANCQKCNGPNEYYTCGGACDNVCATLSKQNQTNCPIINVKCNEKCYCKKGYARDPNNICVPINTCPVTTNNCGINEEYAKCSNSICRPQNCSQKGQILFCAAVIPSICIGKCVCKVGFLRNENNMCVAESKCPDTTNCGINEEFLKCANTICRPQKCSDIRELFSCAAFVPSICISKCVCKIGFLKNENNICVPESQCPATFSPITCPKNEVYSKCANGVCRALHCSQKDLKAITCAAVSRCTEGCVCQIGFLRNRQNICVPANRCDDTSLPNICPKNEVYSACVNGLCQALQCSQKNQKIMACGFVTNCARGCICRPGYLRNKHNFCVPVNQCDETKQCGLNEEYNSCANVLCRAQLCSDRGHPVACPGILERVCRPKCVCKENYLRNENGFCVPEKQCKETIPPITCPKNEVYSACINGLCRSLNCTQKDKITPCGPVASCTKGCVCQAGFLRNSNNICVPANQCDAGTSNETCGLNEEYSTCVNGLCRAQKCSEKGLPIACPSLIEGSCIGGCVCKENFFKDGYGNCVPEKQCDICPKNEIYSTCPAKPCDAEYCPRTRNDPSGCVSTRECTTPRCVCGFNQRRDRTSGKCIAVSSCPPFQCGPNEVYDSCPPVCPGQNCSDYLNNSTCPKFKIGIVVPCVPQCRCIKNFYRNQDGVCIEKSKCAEKPNVTCGLNQEYSNCVNGLCRAQKCTEKGLPIACPDLIEGACIKGCVCKVGFLLNGEGICVPEDQCSVCPKYEIYSTCPAKPCDAEYCPRTRNDPSACVSTKECSTPRCVCGFNQRRDRISGKCIATSSCPPFQCGPNEVYESCPAVCPGQNCSDYLNNSTCPKFRIGIVVPCVPKCRCINNFYRNLDGICIEKTKCSTAVCGRNEEYSTCTNLLCGGQDCSSRGKRINCPLVTKENCKTGCICKKNFFKKDDICVPEDLCPNTEPVTPECHYENE